MRVLLRPNSETLLADLRLLNQKARGKPVNGQIKMRWRSRLRYLCVATDPSARMLTRVLFTAHYIAAPLLGPGSSPRSDSEQSLPYIPT